MNTLNFKGVSSSTITGLIIQELPPITKPQMRTQVTEVDGRDGDIVDTLGYNSYAKDVSIGLFGTFDVDAIAKYFSGSGNLILSNEPDKIYKVDCYDQIDFERLLRYRTAKVRFVAQPYKYKVGEAVQEVAISAQTSITVANVGLEPSKPLIYLEGSGDVTLKLAGLDVCTINIADDYIYLDSEAQDAYINGFLRNSEMTGDFPILQPGNNTLGWTGTVSKIRVTPRSRWL